MNYRRIRSFSLLIAGIVTFILPLSARAEVETYMIDKVHSMADLKIRHLFSNVSGTFSDVTGTIKIDYDNLEASKVEATTTIQRSDYGMNHGLGEGQGGAVGNELEITLLIEGIKLGPDGATFRVPESANKES